MEFLTNFFISCKESRIENNKSFYGCFHLGPFEPGQSITIGNALRRTLLSELKGLAITAVEIDGALHEYSNILGVKDSVLDILLNLKEIVLRKTKNFNTFNTLGCTFRAGRKGRIDGSRTMLSASSFIDEREEQEKSFAYLKVRGPGVVRASDIRLPSNIQCVDPNQYIATLTEDGYLNIKIIIEEGQKFIHDMPANFYNPEALFLYNNKLKNTLISNINKLIYWSGAVPYSSSQTRSPLFRYTGSGRSLAPDGHTFAGILSKEVRKSYNYKEPKRVTLSPNSLLLNKKVIPLRAFAPREGTQNISRPLRGPLETSNILSGHKIKTIIDSNIFRRLCAQRLFLLKKNLLKIDAIFNPVTKVNYIIEIHENERISSNFANINNLETSLDILSTTPFKDIEFFKKGKNKNFLNTVSKLDLKTRKKEDRSKLIGVVKHKIILEIWTNGSIHPRQALQNALNNLVNVFIKLQKTQIFSNFVKKSTSIKGDVKYPIRPFNEEAPHIIFKDMEINNTYSLSQNTKDILFQKWLYLKKPLGVG